MLFLLISIKLIFFVVKNLYIIFNKYINITGLFRVLMIKKNYPLLKNMIYILSLSLLFQLLSAILSSRLIKVTEKKYAWLLISCAIFFMAIRRGIHLSKILFLGKVIVPSFIWQELTALLISLLMLSGIILIAPVFKSITSVRKLEKSNIELEQSNKLKEEFLAILSHEIRTPVSAIIGFTEILLEENLTDTQKENLNYIHASANQLEKLLSNLLQLSVLQSGKAPEINCNKFDIREMVDSIISTFSNELEKKHNVIATQVNIDYFYSDEMRIQQILFNLIGNAIKFTENGNIFIFISQRENSYIIEVKDTGIGILKDKQKKIFEVFEQADSSNRRHFQGVGLGLAITYKFIKTLKGDIYVDSEPGKGSSFKIKLPLCN